MQKWEYAYMLVEPSKYTFDGVEHELDEKTTTRTLLNNMGLDGWEMVDSHLVGTPATVAFFFKRPLENG